MFTQIYTNNDKIECCLNIDVCESGEEFCLSEWIEWAWPSETLKHNLIIVAPVICFFCHMWWYMYIILKGQW